MKKDYGRILSRTVFKGLKIVSISALGCLVALCSPQALCHVMAAGPVRFTTYLMIDDEGEFATDSRGEYIQLFDEKGNLLANNDDVVNYLKDHTSENGVNNLAAKERPFYLIDGKFYLNESGSEELTDLSRVMPAIFKYGGIESGYTLEADNGTVYISPLNVQGNPVYVARIAGAYENLPAFTISSDGDISYFERGSVSGASNEVDFVYDSNYFYDENLNQLLSMDSLIPESDGDDAPMFAGYYIKNGDDRRQFIDIDGSIVLSAADYKDMAGGAVTDAEYCYLVNLYADGADTVTLYSDIESGSLYDDYQRTDGFGNIGDDMLWQLSYDNSPARGHFAGYYTAGEEDGSFDRFIDDGGNLTEGSSGPTDENKDYNARFYHIVSVDGASVYFSDGKVYSDPELTTEISNIADVTGGIPEDSEEKVHSDKKEMDGVAKRYFIGYYFASDFWEDEEGAEREMLLSEYEEEGFDPADVEISKIKFADRDGNIVFNGDDAPDFGEDMTVYQNWYTVTVWDDGEVEVEDEADETKDDEEDIEDEEEKDGEDQSDGETDDSEEKKDDQDDDKEKPAGEEGQEPAVDGTGTDQGGENPSATEPGSSENSDKDTDGDKEGVEENAKPSDKENGTDDGSEAGSDGNDGGSDGNTGNDGGSESETGTDGGSNTGHGGGGNIDMVVSAPEAEEEGEGN